MRTSTPALAWSTLVLWAVACEPEPSESPPSPTPAIMPGPRGPRGPRHAPPLSGGTLLVTRDARTAVASDADRDLVWIVDLQHPDDAVQPVPAAVALRHGDEPGRAAEDAEGYVHVALRRGGAVTTIDPATGTVLRRVPVCAAPRGIAWDDAARLIHVACAGGDLVSLARDGTIMRHRFVAPDLRDVVVARGIVFATTFRTPAVYAVGDDAVVGPILPPAPDTGLLASNRATVAWRAIPYGDSLWLLSQSILSGALGSLSSTAGYYGSAMSPSPPIRAQLTRFSPRQEFPQTRTRSLDMRTDVLAVRGLVIDVAVNSRGDTYAAAGGQAAGQVCRPFPSSQSCDHFLRTDEMTVAVAWATDDLLVAQTLEQNLLFVTGDGHVRNRVPLSRTEIPDLPTARIDGRVIFHHTTRSGFACASCHPEGGEDGRVWTFAPDGRRRRTQPLWGGITTSAPFHWSGDFAHFNELAHTVFTARMGGEALTDAEVTELGAWLDTVSSIPNDAPDDPEAVARGRALFNSTETACATCHSGPRYSNDQTVDVGTGDAFQVPSLVGLGHRAPYMHVGCAATLRERFTHPMCGGGERHGHTAQLTPAQVDDMVAFLETL